MEGLDELVNGGVAELGVGGMSHAAIGVKFNAKSAFGGKGEAVIGGFAVDEKAGAFGVEVGYGGTGRVALFADDEKEADLDVGVAEAVGGGDLGGDDPFGIAGSAAVKELIVFAEAEEGRDGVHMGGENYIGCDAGECGVDVEAVVGQVAGARSGGVIRLLDQGALYGILLGFEILMEKRASMAFVEGSRFDIDEAACEVYGVDGHGVRIPERSGKAVTVRAACKRKWIG